MASSKNIWVTLSLKDKLSGAMTKATATIKNSKKQINRAAKSLKKFGNSTEAVGKTLTTSLTVPLVGVAAAATKTAADFEKSMSNVSAITGATGEDLETLTNLAQDLGKSTAWSAAEVAQAMQYTGMAGWTAQQNVEGLAGILDLASATGSDLASTSDIMTDAISAFGDTAADSARYANVMTSACTSANVSMDTLGESYKYVGAVAGTMNYSIEDVTTALAAMGNMGIKGSQAGTALRTAITNMSAPTDTAAKAMKKLGISLTDSNGEMKSFDEVVDNLQSSFSGLSETEQTAYAKQIFGKNAMTGMLAIVNTSSDAYDQLADTVNNSSEAYDGQGSAAAAAETQLDNLEGQLTLLKSQFEGLAITLGNKFLPYLKQGVSLVSDFATKIDNLSEAQTDTIVKIGAIVAAIGPVLIIIGKVVSTVGMLMQMVTQLQGAFTALSTVFEAVGAVGAGVLAPVVAVVAAIAAVALAVKANWEKVAPAFEHLKNSVLSLWNDAIKPLVEFVGIAAGSIWDTIKPYVTIIGEGIAGIVGHVVDAIANIIDLLRGFLTGDWKTVWEAAKGIVKDIFGTIGDILKVPINTAITLINGAIDKINSKIQFNIPDWVPGVGGKSFKLDIPKIPTLSVGTPDWVGGPVQISEKGGEIVNLPSGAQVIPHDQSVQTAYRAGANKSSNVSISIPKLADSIVVREDSDIDKIATALANKLQKVALNVGGDLSGSNEVLA